MYWTGLIVRWVVAILIGTPFALLGAWLASETATPVGAGVFLAFLAVFIWLSLLRVDEEIPEIAVLTIAGYRLAIPVFEGLCFIPLAKLKFCFGLVKMTAKSEEIKIPCEAVILADGSVVALVIDCSAVVSRIGRYMLAFLNRGKFEGVVKFLANIIQPRAREWMTSTLEGPDTWAEAQSQVDGGVAFLVKAVAEHSGGTGLEKIRSTIPTQALLDLFAGHPPSKSQARHYNEAGEPWKKIKRELNKLDVAELAELKRAVEARRAAVKSFRRGNANLLIKWLGIVLERLDITAVKVDDKIKEAAVAKAVEEQQLASQLVEARTLAALINLLMSSKADGGADLNLEQALSVSRSRLGDVQEELKRHEVSVTPESAAVLQSLLMAVMGARP